MVMAYDAPLKTKRAFGNVYDNIIDNIGTPDVFPDYSGYAAPASPSRACRIVLHPSAFLSFPLRYHSM